MTIKKIGLSALVAATLTTAGFAAGTFDTNTTVTFNKNFLTDMGIDVNVSNYATQEGNITIIQKMTDTQSATFTLSGAKFLGEAANWTLENNNSNPGAEIAMFSKNDTELKFSMSGDVNATNTMFTLKYDNGSYFDGLALSSSSATDVSVNVVFKANFENVVQEIPANTVTAKKLLEMKDTAFSFPTALTCKNRKIDSDDNKKFTVNSNYTSGDVTTVECGFSIGQPAEADIDYNVADTNMTVTISGIPYTDGNVTGKGFETTILGGTPSTPVLVNGDIDITDLNVTGNYTIVYTVNGTAEQSKNQLTATANFNYGKNTALTPVDTNKTAVLFSGLNAMNWELSTYRAEINALYAAPGVQEDYFVVTNNSAVDGDIMVEVIKDGASLGNKLVGSAVSKAPTQLKLSDIYTIFSTSGLVNVILTVPAISSEQVDVVAMMVSNSNGNGRVFLKVVDNNEKNQGN